MITVPAASYERTRRRLANPCWLALNAIDRFRIECLLAMGTEQLLVTTPADHWEISYHVTRLFTQAEESNPFAAVLRLLLTRLRFDVAAFWLVNDLHLSIECAEFATTVDDAAFEKFEVVTRARHFTVGEGLPGTVWKSRQFEYLPDVSHAENFPRASVAEMEGLNTGFAFPVYFGKDVLGVIEMFSREHWEIPAATREFLMALGGQIGVFAERLSAGKALAAADAQFRMVAQAASVAVFTIDEDSTVLFANPSVERIFGYRPDELIGGKLTVIMPDYLRHLHEHAVKRYVATGQRHITWDGVPLPGLHKNGSEIPLTISFGEFFRQGKRVFTGFAQPR